MIRENSVKNLVTMTMQSKGENVALARSLVAVMAAQLDITINELEELKVAISEAVSNAIIHGYQGQEDKQIIVKAELQQDSIEVSIEDTGIGIADINKAMEPSYSSDPERMGLGFAFMKSFTDEMDVESELNQGTKVRLKKRLGISANSQPDNY